MDSSCSSCRLELPWPLVPNAKGPVTSDMGAYRTFFSFSSEEGTETRKERKNKGLVYPFLPIRLVLPGSKEVVFSHHSWRDVGSRSNHTDIATVVNPAISALFVSCAS